MSEVVGAIAKLISKSSIPAFHPQAPASSYVQRTWKLAFAKGVPSITPEFNGSN